MNWHVSTWLMPLSELRNRSSTWFKKFYVLLLRFNDFVNLPRCRRAIGKESEPDNLRSKRQKTNNQPFVGESNEERLVWYINVVYHIISRRIVFCFLFLFLMQCVEVSFFYPSSCFFYYRCQGGYVYWPEPCLSACVYTCLFDC